MNKHHGYRDDRINSVFLRSIGSLTLAGWELHALRVSPTTDDERSWEQYADHLSESIDSIMEAATASTFAGNTISVLRDGVRVAIDEDHIAKLAEKIHRHIQVGRALGLGANVESRAMDLEQTA